MESRRTLQSSLAFRLPVSAALDDGLFIWKDK
jgi:hypothetical protein